MYFNMKKRKEKEKVKKWILQKAKKYLNFRA